MSDSKPQRLDRVASLRAEALAVRERWPRHNWAQHQIQLVTTDLRTAFSCLRRDESERPVTILLADFAMDSAEARIRHVRDVIETYGEDFQTM